MLLVVGEPGILYPGSLGRNICVGEFVGKLFPLVVRGAYKGNSCSFHLSGFREGCEDCSD